MVKVIVFHYTDAGKLPPLSSEELTDLTKKLDSKLKNHPDLTFNGALIGDSGRGFCVGCAQVPRRSTMS